MRKGHIFIFCVTVFALISHVSANATDSTDVTASDAFSQEEQQEIIAIEDALQFYFEEIGHIDQNGDYTITNVDALKNLVAQGDLLAQRVEEIYVNGNSEIGAETAADFAKCIVGKFADSYGSIARAFLKGEIFDLLKKKEWKKSAQLMFKVLRAAGKSVSAASLAVEAGVYGWQCRNKW